jgi:hypothetical protein
MVSPFNKGSECTLTLLLFTVEVNYSARHFCTLVSGDKPNTMQCFLHPNDIFTDFSNETTKRPQTTGMSPNTSPLPAAILRDEPVHLGR